MTRPTLSLVALALAVSGLLAQQPNSSAASLKINGQDGPPYPITNIPVFGGTTATLEIDGGVNVAYKIADDAVRHASLLQFSYTLMAQIIVTVTGQASSLPQ